MEHGTVSPETTGIYFRLVWGRGLSHDDVNRYAAEFERLANASPELAGFPEALLQDVDDAWLTEFPSPEEASHYRLTPEYASFLLRETRPWRRPELERLAEILDVLYARMPHEAEAAQRIHRLRPRVLDGRL